MTHDLSAKTIRENGAKRLRAALAAFDERLFEHHAVAKWVSAATKQQNRRKWLKSVVVSRAARVHSGPALKDAGLNRASITIWDKTVYAHERADKLFRAAIAREVDAIRARTLKPAAMPAPVKEAAR